MIYTSYEMTTDCRDGRPEGWAYFISNYVPMARKLTAHYAPQDAGLMERVLKSLRDPARGLFQKLEPLPERQFLAELRQYIMAHIALRTPEIEIDLETVGAALEPLTMVEKQAAWMETMRYEPEAIGRMLRVAPPTVQKIRDRAAELVRGKVDQWRRTLLAENGLALGKSAADTSTKECVSAKTFLDILDGRMTWRGREEMERHVTTCWHCIDHFSRMAEVVDLPRGLQALTPEEVERYRAMVGIEAPKRGVWKRLLGGS